jgi:tRNA U34 2-thiouridine synthase MnmA/TrmU
MTVRRAIFGIFLAFVIGNNANAADNVAKPGSVEKLYGVCKSPNIDIKVRCAAYIQGFGAMMYVVEKRKTLAAFGVCQQETVTVAEMIQAFLNWTERNPKEWQENGEIGVLASLREAWPCN